jgi:hypothetical protein
MSYNDAKEVKTAGGKRGVSGSDQSTADAMNHKKYRKRGRVMSPLMEISKIYETIMSISSKLSTDLFLSIVWSSGAKKSIKSIAYARLAPYDADLIFRQSLILARGRDFPTKSIDSINNRPFCFILSFIVHLTRRKFASIQFASFPLVACNDFHSSSEADGRSLLAREMHPAHPTVVSEDSSFQRTIHETLDYQINKRPQGASITSSVLLRRR